ncbi:hypothetical protein [Labilibaculum manganireducens]|nr:hypothetical protein [Labilibaculum manganireducens]
MSNNKGVLSRAYPGLSPVSYLDKLITQTEKQINIVETPILPVKSVNTEY